MLRSIAIAALIFGSWFATIPTASAQTLVPCARENEFCRVPYPTRVVYGVPGRRTALEVGAPGISCSNDMFGDPANGIPKRCAYVARGGGDRWHGQFDEGGGRRGDEYGRRSDGYRGPGREIDAFRYRDGDDGSGSAWRTCASENGYCSFAGVRRVRYGARGRFVEGRYRDGTACSNSVFGDPVPGQPKFCQALD
jgi:hypothetical protein